MKNKINKTETEQLPTVCHAFVIGDFEVFVDVQHKVEGFKEYISTADKDTCVLTFNKRILNELIFHMGIE